MPVRLYICAGCRNFALPHQVRPASLIKKNWAPFMPIMQKLVPNRIVIYARDIENITGRKERAARELLRRIRDANGKKPGQFITVSEFCQYTGLKEGDLIQFLKY